MSNKPSKRAKLDIERLSKRMREIAMKCVTLILLFISSQSIADTYLDIYGLSKHLDADNNLATGKYFRETNRGLGLSYEFEDGNSIGIAHYDNSIGNKSTAIAYEYSARLSDYVSTGVQVGVVTGYYNKYSPVLAPVLTIGRIVRLRIGGLPEIDGKIPAVIYMSLQVRVK